MKTDFLYQTKNFIASAFTDFQPSVFHFLFLLLVIILVFGFKARNSAPASHDVTSPLVANGSVNPVTGLHMVGGVDVAGNPYGISIQNNSHNHHHH